MGTTTTLTLPEAAARLRVHYQTVYRWVRAGQLPAVKVAGNYLVDTRDLDDFAVTRAAPEAPTRRVEVRDWDHQAGRFHQALIDGDELAVREQAHRLHEGGVSVADLCDRVLAPALVRIGDGWARATVSIAEEHRAAAICERLLGRLTPAPPGRPRGVCVVASPPGDEHRLAGAMATAALREDHWRVHHLGVNVPAGQVSTLASSEGAGLVVLSVTYPPALARAETIASTLSTSGRRVLVGRPGVTLGDLVSLARRLRDEPPPAADPSLGPAGRPRTR
jgi:excisionase family DNA binding protein